MKPLKNFARKLLILFFSLILVFAFSNCIPKAYANASTSTDSQTYTDSSIKSISQQISELDGVSNVSVTESKGELPYKQQIKFYVEQPISWENKSLGTFKQQVILLYNQQAGLTIFETGGYFIGTSASALTSFGTSKNENIVMMEYRFFGDSRPEGLDNTKHSLWEYCTEENAANDFHAIYQKLHTILAGKAIMTGGSKGGYTTIYQAYYQDRHGVSDFDALYPFSSPLCSGISDDRIWDFINNRAGDSSFGADKGSELRSIIFNMQLALFEVKVEYAPELWNMHKDHLNKDFFKFDDTTNAYKFFDYTVSNIAADFWQNYSEKTVADYQADLNLSGEERKTALKKIINSQNMSIKYSYIDYNYMFPYYIQAYHTMGELKLCWDDLRTAVKKKNIEDPSYPLITLTEEECNSYQTNIFLSDDIKNCDALKYDSSVHEALVAWYPTTKQNIINRYGDVDPWKAVGFPAVTSNPHIQNYLAYKVGHSCQPSDLSQAEQTRFWNYYNATLSIDINDAVIEVQGTSTATANNNLSSTSNSLYDTAYVDSLANPELRVTYQGIIVPSDNYSVSWSEADADGNVTATLAGQKAFAGTVSKTINIGLSEKSSVESSDYTAQTSDNLSLILCVWMLLVFLSLTGLICIRMMQNKSNKL